jgi:predicted  nucleic acid-binding Zn-ribbon protein
MNPNKYWTIYIAIDKLLVILLILILTILYYKHQIQIDKIKFEIEMYKSVKSRLSSEIQRLNIENSNLEKEINRLENKIENFNNYSLHITY